MTCESLLGRALALLDGRLDAEDREEALRHLEGCAGCRELLAALAAAGDVQDDPALVDAIVARTTGGACDGARSRLCAWVDDEMDPADASLIRGHLRHCPECDALVRSLRLLREELPRLAEAEPEPGFVDAVLARTSRRPREAALPGRWSSAIARLLDRPRIALEGAFVASAVAVLPFVFVPAPFAVANTRHVASEIEASVAVGTRAAWAASESFVVLNSSAIVSAFSRRSTETLASIRWRHGTFPVTAASGEARGANRPVDRNDQAAQETTR